MPIDPRLIDVDFARESRYVAGCLPEPPERRAQFSAYGDVAPLIPESQWRELSEAAKGKGLRELITRVYDQGGEGSCVANACAQAHEILQAKTFGRERVVHLSAISLYKRIGRSAGSGAMVSDGIDELADRGVVPLDDATNRARFGGCVMPNTGFRAAYPANWEATAKHFRTHEWYAVGGEHEMFSALLHQHPVVVGRAGHSITYIGIVWEGGRWLVPYINSWSAQWGDGGIGYDSARLYQSAAREAYACRTAVHPGL